jgi:hypothetical protein
MARKLLIAVSVLFGLATVALCALWVRSFWRLDQVYRSGATIYTLYSSNGAIGFAITEPFYIPPPNDHWEFASANSNGRWPTPFLKSTKLSTTLAVPHVLLAFLPAAIACLPWLRWKFSLRAMLIATTLVAFVLGLAAWAGGRVARNSRKSSCAIIAAAVEYSVLNTYCNRNRRVT